MALYLAPNNEYPRFIGDLLLDHPEYKDGDPLPTGWSIVKEVEYPTVEQDEIIVENSPELINGVLTQSFTVRPMNEDELARRNAPVTARGKLLELGLNEYEIQALARGLVN